MVIDYRYHVITIVAIFLSLGLGVLIGGALFSDEDLLKSQSQIVQRLERDFAALRDENRQLSQNLNGLRLDLNQNRQFMQWLLPRAVEGRLTGRTFALVKASGSGNGQYLAELGDLLKKAGAELVVEVSINPQKWSQASQAEYQKLAGLIAVGLRGPAITSLEQAGFLQFAGKSPRPAKMVLVISGQGDQHFIQSTLQQAGLETYLLPSDLSSLEERARLIFDLVDEVQR